MAPLWMRTLSLTAVLVIVAVFQVLMPRLTRPDLLFSVTIDPAYRQTDEARRSIRRYQLQVGLLAIVALGVCLIGAVLQPEPLFLAALFGLALATLAPFLAARQRTLPHAVAPAPIREAQITPRRRGLPGGWAVQAGPFLILGVAALWAGLHWAAIPARIPTHWTEKAHGAKWVDKSVVTVFLPLIVGFFYCAFVRFLSVLIGRTRRINALGPAGASEGQFRRSMQIILLFAGYFVALVNAALVAMRISASPAIFYLVLIGPPVLVLASILISLRFGQGGSRLAQAPAGAGPVGDRTRDEYWKLGLFYVNRNDPALIIEKRFGIGYTFNFGRLTTWLILAAIVLLPIGFRLFRR